MDLVARATRMMSVSSPGTMLQRKGTLAHLNDCSSGEPGGDTWGDLPLTFRAGGDAWISGSYDPETNLVYWGTAQAKPWAESAAEPTATRSTRTRRWLWIPTLEKIKWYYQHLPGETQDMDEVFENILVDVGGRKSLFKMGKLGILWQLDRMTGQFIHATDLGYQTIVQVNAQSGKVTYLPGKIPQLGADVDMCPSTADSRAGARWRSALKPMLSTFP